MKTMEISEAKKLIQTFMNATIKHYEVANGIKKSKDIASIARKEYRATERLLKALSNKPFMESDIEDLLKW
jgi:DNA-binding phage protein